jgi:hypothetical protein
MLEREAQRNVEVMWLTGKLAPDFPGLSARTGKTIANFRKDNRTAIQQVCRAFTSFCRDLDLFRRDLVAIDGSKFKAVNTIPARGSRQRNFTDRKLQRALQEIDRKIEAYLDELDANDAEEPEEPKLSAEQLKEKIRLSKERMKEYRGLLSMMALRAKRALSVDRLEVLTDMGYYDGQQVKACLESGITPYIPKPNTSANSPLGLFGKEDFRYDPHNDCYRCPAGEQLSFRWQSTEKGRQRRYYTTPACARCSLKPRCTRDPGGRRISRWTYEDLLDEMQRRVRASPEKMKLRKQLAERPFGTIKRAWNQGYFLTRGLQNVRAEMSLTILAYNFKRVIKILGVPRMMEALA